MRPLHWIVLPTVLALAACAQSEPNLSPDFGVALRQSLAAQIADPDAQYAGVLAPGYDGTRAALAQSRYQKNNVIQPVTPNASSYGAMGSGNGGAMPAAAPTP